MTEKPIEKMTFEEALAELEAVVGKLESSNAQLDESIELYERGSKLRTHCENKLSEAEEKVAKITRNADGTPGGLAPIDPQ